MNSILAWWYALSLPKRGPDTSPEERERTRYARLTSGLILLILSLSLLLTPLSLFNSYNPWAPSIAIVALLAVILSAVLSKLGYKNAAACMVILSSIISITGTMLTNPLDLSLIPIFNALVIPVLEAGALIAPAGALVMGGIDCVIILLIVTFQRHTPAYDAAMRLGLYSVTIALPIAIQIFVAVVAYIIFRSLVNSFQRANQAEEIIALQEQVRAFEQQHTQQQQDLDSGLSQIARVLAQADNGNLSARVPLGSDHILWQIAGPLNNLLSRTQRWKQEADKLEWLQNLLSRLTWVLQQARVDNQIPSVSPTSTEIDPLLTEIQFLIERGQAQDIPRKPMKY